MRKSLYRFSSIKITLAVLAAIAAGSVVQQVDRVFGAFIENKASFLGSGYLRWTADLSSLKKGDYFIGLGRPRAQCELYLDGKLVDQNIGPSSGIRSNLMMGSHFRVEKDYSARATKIRCVHQAGFPPGLTHIPIISDYYSGQFLNLLRSITMLLLGPIFSVLLFFSAVFAPLSNKKFLNPTPNKKNVLLIIFSVCALLYSLSLAHFPRLFFEDELSTYLHIVLRNLFALSFIFYIGSLYEVSRIAVASVTLVLFISLFQMQFSAVEEVVNTYVGYYFVYPVSTLLSLVALLRSSQKHQLYKLHIFAAAVFFATQVMDTMSMYNFYGVFNTPSMIAILAVVIRQIQMAELRRAAGVELTSNEILSVTRQNKPINLILERIAKLTFEFTQFQRVSAYIDAFVTGNHDQPGEKFLRIYEDGYSKDTKNDFLLDFRESRGLVMQNALDGGSIHFGVGERDHSNFAVVPIGKLACINFSDEMPRDNFLFLESKEYIQRIYPALNVLERRLIEHSVKGGVAVERIRSIRGFGEWSDSVGCIFVDIDDYSSLVSRYSQFDDGKGFSSFVSQKYLPSLTRFVAPFGYPEFVEGDLVYFLVLKELVPASTSVTESTWEVLRRVSEFVLGMGRAICAENGYEPLTVSIGVSFGSASIKCNEDGLKTAGATVNRAARMLKSAPKGTVLVDEAAARSVGSGFVVKRDLWVLEKKDLLRAKLVIRDSVNEKKNVA